MAWKQKSTLVLVLLCGVLSSAFDLAALEGIDPSDALATSSDVEVDGVVEEVSTSRQLVAGPSGIPFTPKGINYKGGYVMWKPINLYVIYYGRHEVNDIRTVRSFLKALSPSRKAPKITGQTVAAWWKRLSHLYVDKKGRHVTSYVRLAGEASDSKASQGLADLTCKSFQTIIRRQLKPYGGKLPVDKYGIYIVLLSRDAYATDQCYNFNCGNHYVDSFLGQRLKWIRAANAIQLCPEDCSWNEYLSGPNGGDGGADGLVQLLAQLLGNTVTNTFGDAWQTLRKPSAFNDGEVMDFCRTVYSAKEGGQGQLFTGPPPVPGVPESVYNVREPYGRRFLLPSIWDPITGKCGLTL